MNQNNQQAVAKNPEVLHLEVYNGNNTSQKAIFMFTPSANELQKGKPLPSLKTVQEAIIQAYQSIAEKESVKSEQEHQDVRVWADLVNEELIKSLQSVAMEIVHYGFISKAEENAHYLATGKDPAHYLAHVYYDTNTYIPLVFVKDAANQDAENNFKSMVSDIVKEMPDDIPVAVPKDLKDIAPVMSQAEWANTIRSIAAKKAEEYGFHTQTVLMLKGKTAMANLKKE